MRFEFVTCLTLLAVAASGSATASDGTYDNSYGNQGRRAIPELGSVVSDIATVMLPDGRLVMAATQQFNERIVVLQLRTDGSLDPGFGTTGFGYTELPALNTENYARGIALTANGRFVVLGDDGLNALELYELNAGGALIRSTEQYFNNAAGTSIASEGEDIVALPNGQMLVAGAAWNGSSRDLAVARFNADFSKDAGFASQGTYLEGFGLAGLQDDRAIDVELAGGGLFVVAGNTVSSGGAQTNAVVVQFEANGVPDIDFGNFGGIYFTNGPRSVGAGAVRVDRFGRVVVGGWIGTVNSTELWLHRLLSDGSSDFGFGVGANVVVPFDLAGSSASNVDYATALDIDAQDRILVGGQAVRSANLDDTAAVAVRLNDTGTPDEGFAAGGKVVRNFAEPGIVPSDIGNAVASIHATPLGTVLSGGAVLGPSQQGVTPQYAATLRLAGGDPIFKSSFENGEPAP